MSHGEGYASPEAAVREVEPGPDGRHVLTYSQARDGDGFPLWLRAVWAVRDMARDMGDANPFEGAPEIEGTGYGRGWREDYANGGRVYSRTGRRVSVSWPGWPSLEVEEEEACGDCGGSGVMTLPPDAPDSLLSCGIGQGLEVPCPCGGAK